MDQDVPGSFRIEPSAPERLPEVFQALSMVQEAAWAAAQEIVPVPAGCQRVFLQMFDRAFNTLKGAKLLLENDHWELAAAHVRQLFELNLNAEEILRATDREKAAFEYARFALLQEFRNRIADLRYALASGRRSDENVARLAELEARARQWFSDLGKESKSGEWRWKESWCDKTTKQMAFESTHVMRKYQYETIFSFLSAYTHGAPMAISGAHVNVSDFDELLEADNHWTGLIGAMLMTFFAEFWIIGQEFLPEMPASVPEAQRMVIEFLGGPTTPNFDT